MNKTNNGAVNIAKVTFLTTAKKNKKKRAIIRRVIYHHMILVQGTRHKSTSRQEQPQDGIAIPGLARLDGAEANRFTRKRQAHKTHGQDCHL